MRFRKLGAADMQVSEVGFSLWPLSGEGWEPIPEADAVSLLVAAYELGVNYYDLADSDGDGYAETLLRKAIGRFRHDIVLGVKVGYDFTDRVAVREHGAPLPNFEPAYIRKAAEDSLGRLGSDYIDLLQLQHPRVGDLEDDALFETLDDLAREGKIRCWGIDLGPGLAFREVGELCMAERSPSALQAPYNALDQEPARAVFAAAEVADPRPGLIVRSPHASGLLDGAYTKRTRLKRGEFDSDAGYEALSRGIEMLGELDFLTDNMDGSIGQIAIRFALHTYGVATVLPNVRSVERLREFAAAPETRELPRAMLSRLTELHDEYFHPAASNPDAV